jgi:hypothetical protein
VTEIAIRLLAQASVHPTRDSLGAETFCQCATCFRVARALARVALAAQVEVEIDRDVALDAYAHAQRLAAQLQARLTVADGQLLQEAALVPIWRALAVIERTTALSQRAMTPTARANHNHRGLVFDACAKDLAAVRVAQRTESGARVTAPLGSTSGSVLPTGRA